ncbi:hypothetical protein [Myroides odoratimimus]|uniref:hypothetical protein n=1 Tax=Myroides odoratimimus TaxID=76832 RepID=UPI001CE1DC8F|nr:hypothetical protein [Myroides odoratimimus]MCA4806539.1 hypothetical protein [Myroides odoratimimus]
MIKRTGELTAYIHKKGQTLIFQWKCGDMDGTILEPAQKSQRGVTPSKHEVQLDHIEAKSKGGQNSGKNAQVVSREQNRNKWDT